MVYIRAYLKGVSRIRVDSFTDRMLTPNAIRIDMPQAADRKYLRIRTTGEGAARARTPDTRVIENKLQPPKLRF